VGGRLDRVVNAVTIADLSCQVADLPSAMELSGNVRTPSRVRKMLIGFRWEKLDSWPVYAAGLAFSLVVAIAFPVFLMANHSPLGDMRMMLGITCIILGAVGFFTSVMRLCLLADL
jgi:ABC-type tungstate transport system substrate-binding protein